MYYGLCRGLFKTLIPNMRVEKRGHDIAVVARQSLWQENKIEKTGMAHQGHFPTAQ